MESKRTDSSSILLDEIKEHKSLVTVESKQSDEAISVCLSILDCGICLEPLAKPASLSCGHSFCMACILSISTCPLCREPIPTASRAGRKPNYLLIEYGERFERLKKLLADQKDVLAAKEKIDLHSLGTVLKKHFHQQLSEENQKCSSAIDTLVTGIGRLLVEDFNGLFPYLEGHQSTKDHLRSALQLYRDHLLRLRMLFSESLCYEMILRLAASDYIPRAIGSKDSDAASSVLRAVVDTLSDYKRRIDEVQTATQVVLTSFRVAGAWWTRAQHLQRSCRRKRGMTLMLLGGAGVTAGILTLPILPLGVALMALGGTTVCSGAYMVFKGEQRFNSANNVLQQIRQIERFLVKVELGVRDVTTVLENCTSVTVRAKLDTPKLIAASGLGGEMQIRSATAVLATHLETELVAKGTEFRTIMLSEAAGLIP